MAMKKTIGGDRLGTGKRMQVDLKNYERSTHDLGYIWRSTMAAGTLVPFTSFLGLPGDTFDIDLNCEVLTHPTLGPLFGSMKVQLDMFMTPIRLYQGKLHNNKLGIGMNMNQILLPQLEMDAPFPEIESEIKDLDNEQINPSSLFKYLGISGLGIREGGATNLRRNFNAVPYLAYWDIYKNYYANKQEEIGAYIHAPIPSIIETLISAERVRDAETIPQTPAQDIIDWRRTDVLRLTYSSGLGLNLAHVVINTDKGSFILDQLFTKIILGIGTADLSETTLRINEVYSWRYLEVGDWEDKEPVIETFNLENIDLMREDILQSTKDVQYFAINNLTYEPYGPPMTRTGTFWCQKSNQEGLALKTYQSDLFNNWLQTEWIDGATGVNEITAIDTSDGKFTIDTLNLSQKVYEMLNRIAVSGGSYDDWLDAVYTHQRYRKCETPMYMGGLSKELVFQEVISNAAAVGEDVSQPLGTLGGRGKLSSKHKGGKITIKVDEPCYIMGIVSITPRLDYSQGNTWDVNLKTMDDLHKPALDEIGFQDLITDQMAWWDTKIVGGTNTLTFKSAGKQPAWINYMTNVNRTYGNFAVANNEMFMTLNRRYEKSPVNNYIQDLTTYVDPVKSNYIFAEVRRDAQNYWTQIGLDITARRKMSAKVMPNL